MSTNKKAALGEDRAAQETQSSGSNSSTRDAKSSFAQAAIKVVAKSEDEFNWGLISLSRNSYARRFWANHGLTLQQRDQAAQALVDSGEFCYDTFIQLLVIRRVESPFLLPLRPMRASDEPFTRSDRRSAGTGKTAGEGAARDGA